MKRAIGPVAAGVFACVVVVAVFGVAFSGALRSMEARTLDARFRVRGETPVSDRIAIVAVDDDSQRRLGLRIQRRAGFAELVRALRAAGTRVIAIDALFPDEEHVLPPALADDVDAWLARPASAQETREVAEARGLLQRVHDEEQGDERLADALRGDDVVLALHAGETAGFVEQRDDLKKAMYGTQIPGREMPYVAHRMIASLPALHAAVGRLGMATIIVDGEDQTARHVELGRTFHEQIVMPFSVAIAAAALHLPRADVAYDADARTLHLGAHVVPAGPGHRLLVNHRGAAAFPVVSAADVLDGRNLEALHDAIAIVAFTELGQDTVRTPFASRVPGAVLHATVVSNLLHGDALARPTPVVDVVAALVLGLIGALLFAPRLSWRAGTRVVVVVALAVGWLVAAQLAFTHALLALPVVLPLTALASSSLAALVVAWGAEGVQRARLRRTFSHYLADDVIEELLQNPRALAPGGERRELTVLFSDICGFTGLSEELDPMTLVQLLNAYFTPMTSAVLEHRGLLDKYIGDAVMAVFGAPVKSAMHADDALACVLTMHARLAALQGAEALQGRRLKIGIGLNTGEMVVGNMGGAERFDYTVVGDAVNLASRVEGLTRTYGAFCLVGEATKQASSKHFRFREVDLVRVKGKKQPVALYELLGDEHVTIADHRALDVWSDALRAWRAGRFHEAERAFRAFAAENPADVAASLFLARLASLAAVPGAHAAPAGWDGVFEQTSK